MSANGARQNKERTVYFEICRVIAVFFVMFQHTGARGADAWAYTESTWVYGLSMLGSIISSIGVPLFFMISGALLLPRKESWKSVYRKRILRIAATLVIFSVLRYLYLCIVEGQNGSTKDFFWRLYTQEIFLPYWFLYEYLGILVILPFLSKMMQNLTEQEKQVLFLAVLGWHILNDVSNIIWGVGFVLNLRFHSPISYFILGYLMENCRLLVRRERKGVLIAIGQAVLMTAMLYSWVRSQHSLEALGSFFMLFTISVYYLIRCMGAKRIWDNPALHRFVLWCGRNVFGIYLMEDYLRNATVFIWEWCASYISAVPACVPWLLAVFLSGNVLVAGMRRMPVMRSLL